MSEPAESAPNASVATQGSSKLSLMLAMAMFVLVVDTSIMNVSVTAVARDLDTSVSSVQSAIAIEALVSAAFILISSKLGDLMGRKRAFILGLLGYAIGAVAMSITSNITVVLICWAVIGGLGASLLLPAMQSLIHGNFQGTAMKKTYALVGASAAIAAAVGPLIGGFVTTFLSWRVGFMMEAVIIVVVLANMKLVRDAVFTGVRKIDTVGAGLSIVGMGGLVLGILVWQEGGAYVGLLMAIGAVALFLFARWLVRRKREGKVALIDPDLFEIKNFRVGALAMVLQQTAIGGTMIAVPLYLQVTLEYNAMESGLSLAPLSLTMFAVALLMGKQASDRRPASIIRMGFGLALVGLFLIIPVIPRGESGLSLLVPLLITGVGLGLLVSQLNNYILGPIEEERVSEAAGVNSAGQSFGLSFGLAMGGGIMLAVLTFSFVSMTESSDVIPVDDQEAISDALEDSAQLISTTQLEELLAGQPAEIVDEIVSINSAAGNRALQAAMLVPVLACLFGFVASFRMMRLPDFKPSAAVEGLVGG